MAGLGERPLGLGDCPATQGASASGWSPRAQAANMHARIAARDRWAMLSGEVMTQSMPFASDVLGAPAKARKSTLDTIFRPLAKRLQDDHMSKLGIATTMRLARDYNWMKYRRQHAWRDRLYREQFEALLAENGGLTRPRIELKDGYAIDTSMSFPHLDRILDVSEEIIEERSGVVRRQYRSFFQNIWTEEYVRRYPAFLDFATSSDILAPVGDTLQSVPIMSTTAPPGIRFVESSEAFDTDPTRPKDSQLYHIDPYSLPNLYVVVLLRDTAHNIEPSNTARSPLGRNPGPRRCIELDAVRGATR